MNGVVFVFPGQGAQWRGMGSALLEQEPVFAAAIRECELALEPYTDRSVTDVLAGRADADRIDVVQPALFALQVGLARLWKAHGVVPAAVVGHSLGEIAAAHVAGALTLAEAARIVGVRSRLYRRLSGAGAMALVGLGWEETATVVAEQNDRRRAVLKVPGTLGVLGADGTGDGRSGGPAGGRDSGHDGGHDGGRICLAAANAPGSTVVAGDHDAVHALVEQLRWEDVFCRLVGADVAGHSHHVDPLLPELREELAALVPNRAATPLWSTVTGRPGAVLDADYWCRNLREPVLFWPAIRQLLDAGYDTFVELSPHPTLLSGLRDLDARLLASVHKEDTAAFAGSLARLREVELTADGPLGDHRVEGRPVFPGAGYLAAALEHSGALTGVEFHTPLLLDAPCRLATRLDGDAIDLTVEGRTHASASRATPPTAPIRVAHLDLPPLRSRCATRIGAEELYAGFTARGMHYGPAFQRIEEVFTAPGESLARLRAASPLSRTRAGRPGPWPYRLDVALLDACLQAAAPVLAEGDDLYLPRAVAGVSVLGEVGEARWAHARVASATDAAPYENPGTGDGAEVLLDIDACDEDGRIVLALRGVRLRRIARGAVADGWTYTTRWVPVETGADEPFDGVVHRVEPGRPAEEALRSLLELTRELISRPEPERLWVVTRNAQPVESGDPVDPDAAAVWGMARTIRHEHPELRCTLIDLDAEPEPSWIPADLGAGDADADAGDERPIWRLAGENEVAVRGGRPFAPRLTPRAAGPRGPHRLVQRARQDLATLSLAEDVPREPGAGEVRIRVHAAGLNFNDVLRGIGMLGEQPEPLGYGLECAGEVTAVGDGVTGLAAGSRVVALVAEIGAMASHVTVDARLAVPIPDDLDFTTAATLPAAYLTVVYGMERLARLEAGERVLIHAAAGGVGQAAVRLARRAGAEVLATAGSPGKRDWLREQGIRHVFDSRSLDFADQVLEVTGGAGVDMVVNCLAGPAVDEGLRILAPFGRFVELGKRDIAENRPLPLAPFAKSLSFHAVEAFSLAGRRPELVGAMLREVVDAVAEGGLAPLPVTAFPAAEAEAAFRHMASARHIGKVVLTFDRPRLRADGTYLVTGGLSGLGLAAAEGLVRQGARHLALLGRGGPGQAARERIAALREEGVRVVVLAADVADAGALEAALDGLRAQAPPIRGVLHAAGVLRDRTIAAIDSDEVAEVLRPKVAGTRNLHRLTCGDPLEMFVLFSSAAGLLGSGGQAGYAAANAFLDGFAHWRRSRGLPATSVDWGVWSQTGLAARPDRAGRLADRGMGPIDTASGLRILAELLAELPAQVAVVPLDAPTWFANNPGHEHWSIFAGLAAGHAGAGRLSITTPQELERALTEWVAGVLRTSPAVIDPRASLTRLGLDSLMAVELRNLLEARLGVRLPAPVFLDGPTVTELADRVSAQLGDRPAGETDTRDPMAARLDALSDAQVDALLDELLNDHIGGMA